MKMKNRHELTMSKPHANEPNIILHIRHYTANGRIVLSPSENVPLSNDTEIAPVALVSYSPIYFILIVL